MEDINLQLNSTNKTDIEFEICGLARVFSNQLFEKQIPEFRDFTPTKNCYSFFSHISEDGWVAIRITYDDRMQMIVGPKHDKKDTEIVSKIAKTKKFISPEELHNNLDEKWISYSTFSYIGPYKERKISEEHFISHVIYWLNTYVIPQLDDINKKRVLRAIPTPPEYDIKSIFQSMWVLECENELIQGTAFEISEKTFVTCAHVLGSNTKAFRYDDPSKKYAVEVISQNEAIDLATIRIFTDHSQPIETGDSTKLVYMDHILLVGHPNYRLGDKPIISPGLITGFRRKSGITRFITNAPIVRGASGGPVLNASNQVIGVAVTGAETLSETANTEDLGVIPIEAIDLMHP